MRADRSEAAGHTASSTPPPVARIDMAKKTKAVVLGVGAEKGRLAAAGADTLRHLGAVLFADVGDHHLGAVARQRLRRSPTEP